MKADIQPETSEFRVPRSDNAASLRMDNSLSVPDFAAYFAISD